MSTKNAFYFTYSGINSQGRREFHHTYFTGIQDRDQLESTIRGIELSCGLSDFVREGEFALEAEPLMGETKLEIKYVLSNGTTDVHGKRLVRGPIPAVGLKIQATYAEMLRNQCTHESWDGYITVLGIQVVKN